MDSEIQFSYTILGLGAEPFQERFTLKKGGSTDVWIKQISDALRPVFSEISANNQSQDADSARQQVNPFPVNKSGPSPAELAEIISQGVGAAMQEVISSISQTMRPPVENQLDGSSPRELAEIISQGVGAAMQEVMNSISQTMRPPVENQLDGPSPRELAEIISQGVGAAMQEVVASMSQQFFEWRRQIKKMMAQSRPSSQELAEIISQGVGAAMQETMAALTSLPLFPPLPEIPPGPSPQELAQIISNGVSAAMQEAIMAIKEQIAVASRPRP